MGLKIDAVKTRAQAMLNVAQREKDKRAQAKKDAASDEDAVHEDAVQPIRGLGGLVDRTA